jgi:starvation-inducible DNA-binding protein
LFPDYDLAATTSEQHVCTLVKGAASLAAQLRTDVGLAEELADKATADLLTEVTRQVDKDLWFLEAHLQA